MNLNCLLIGNRSLCSKLQCFFKSPFRFLYTPYLKIKEPQVIVQLSFHPKVSICQRIEMCPYRRPFGRPTTPHSSPRENASQAIDS